MGKVSSYLIFNQVCLDQDGHSQIAGSRQIFGHRLEEESWCTNPKSKFFRPFVPVGPQPARPNGIVGVWGSRQTFFCVCQRIAFCQTVENQIFRQKFLRPLTLYSPTIRTREERFDPIIYKLKIKFSPHLTKTIPFIFYMPSEVTFFTLNISTRCLARWDNIITLD